MVALFKLQEQKSQRHWKQSSDLHFAKIRSDHQKRQETPPLVPEEQEELTLTEQAEQTDLSGAFLPDERLHSLARSYNHFNIGERENLSFAAYVKAVTSKRWAEYVKVDTIETRQTLARKYRLSPINVQYPDYRKRIGIVKVMPVVFIGLIVLILILSNSF